VILWATQSVSMIGSALTFFSITILLTQSLYPAPEQKTQLAFALSAISLGFGLPNIIFAPIAGAWADRYDRKTIMIWMDYLGAILSQVLLVMLLTGTLHLWLLILVVVLFSITGAFHGAAFDTSYAMLVSEKQLPRANGMMQTIWSLSGILSPAIAAALIALPNLARQGSIPGSIGLALSGMANGVPIAIALDVFTFFLAAVIPLFLFIPSPQHQKQEKPQSMWADIREGATFIWQRRPIIWLLTSFTVANLFLAFAIIQRPLMVKFNLAPDWSANGFTFETAFALLSSVGGIGGIASGFLISTWGGLRTRRVFGVLVPMIITGFAQIIYGFSPWLTLTAAATALWSAMIPILNAHSQAIWQSVTPRELQGRVFSVRRVIAQFTIPLGTLLGGSAGGFFDPGIAMAVGGTLMVIFTITQLFNPALLRIEDKEYMARVIAAASSKMGTQPIKARPNPSQKTGV
ncbi:MAG: MFS transporter, partial [Anaerolineaceae bacterium]|nr:MFS transporter [Anaerolineaceae bacterium]